MLKVYQNRSVFGINRSVTWFSNLEVLVHIFLRREVFKLWRDLWTGFNIVLYCVRAPNRGAFQDNCNTIFPGSEYYISLHSLFFGWPEER